MPAAQVIDLSPIPRQETTLEKTVGSFVDKYRQNQIEEQENDVLGNIYKQHQQDGQNLQSMIEDIQTRPGLSPTKRVNTINQLTEFAKVNAQLQKTTQAQQAAEQKKAANAGQVRQIEKAAGMEEGALAAYDDNPALAYKMSKPGGNVGGLGGIPLKPEEAQAIKDVLKANPDADAEALEVAFVEAGIPPGRTSGIIESRRRKEEKNAEKGDERGSILRKEQAKADIGFVLDQTAKIPQIAAKQRVFDEANKVNEQGVTGKPWDQIMNKAGLLQYTSDGYRVFTSISKDVIKNTNIKDVIGSQISQQEFKFFTDATINPNFSKEANRQIIKKDQIALRYEKLYADITKSLVDQNGGEPPERIQQKVNDEYNKQAENLSKELEVVYKDYDAIQNVPPGKILMFDTERRPLHVDPDQVAKFTKLGATSS